MKITQIINLLSTDEQRKGMKMVASVLLATLLDFVGLAALLPIIYFLLDNNENRMEVLVFCLFAILFIAAKNWVKVYLGKYQQHYLMNIYKRFSCSLFDAYYQRGLLYIKEQGSSKLGFDVNQMCYSFSYSVISTIFHVMGDGILVLLVMIALTLYNPTTSAVLLLSFAPFVVIYLLAVRNIVKRYGKDEQLAKRQQARLVTDTYRGYAELETNGAYSTIKQSFMEGMDKIGKSRLKLDNYLRLPNLLAELSVIIGLTLLVAFKSTDTKIVIGIFAVAAFRLLPAVKNIMSGWAQLQNASYVVDSISKGIKDYNDDSSKDSETIILKNNLSVDNLVYNYPNGEKVLNCLSFTIHKGEYIGFKGTSGVGKSTLFNLLLGFLSPTEGNILIDNIPLTKENRKAWLSSVGFVPQDVYIFDGTLAENIALGCEEIDKNRISSIIKQVDLWEWTDALPNHLDTLMSEAGLQLSAGQRQRIGIARALYKKVSVLFLDEATSSLDYKTEKDVIHMLDALREQYKELTILAISHRESILYYCDQTINLE